MAPDFNEHYDKATRLGQIIQGQSGKVDPLCFKRALDILAEFNVTLKKDLK